MKELEDQAFDELERIIAKNSDIEPLRQYVETRFEEAGNHPRERMRVMMELLRFQFYLEQIPEYAALSEYYRNFKKEKEAIAKKKKNAA